MYNSKKSKKKNRNKNKKKKNHKEDTHKKKNEKREDYNEDDGANQYYDEEIEYYQMDDEKNKQLKSIDFEKDVLRYVDEKVLSLKIGKKINFSDPIFKENNYILTNEIKEKLSQLYYYMKNQIPCILEGETGTSKTFSTIILSKYLAKNWKKENLHENFKLIRFNLSSESKTSDLIGKYTGAKNSFAGINFQPGPFITAFKEGHCLLLDEINLANPSLLQCIEEALDTKVLSVEVPGFPIEPISMHKNFCLIATQNPNKGFFIKKRNELKKEFLSRLQIITFNEFTKEELLDICKGMMGEIEFYEKINIINDLIDFHLKWIQQPEVKNDIKYFTLREISLFIQTITDENNKLLPYEIILIIYGSKYPQNKFYEIYNILKGYDSFKEIKYFDKDLKKKKKENKIIYSVNSKNDFEELKKLDGEKFEEKEEKIEFENCFENKSLKRAVNAINYAFKYGKNVLILGKKGVGKTQLALWMAEFYDKNNNVISNEENEKDILMCICNEIIKTSDLIGRQKPVDDLNNPIGELIRWENGFVVEGLIKGKCIILDRLETAEPTVTERLNNLLDINYIHDTEYFSIPENPELKEGIKIDPNFRIIATVDEEGLAKMSPAFINRFLIVYLDDQLTNISPEDIKSFTSIMLNKVQSDEKLKIKNDSNNLNRPKFMDEENSYDSDNSSNISLNEEIKEQVSIVIEDNYIENNLNIYKLSKFCRIIGILINKYGKDFLNDIISIGKFLSFSENKNLYLSEHFKSKIIEEYPDMDINLNEEETFFIKSSEELINLFCLLYICFLTQTHICIEGKTGIGKTAFARAFSEILKTKKHSINNYRVFSFHNGTISNDFYGSLTLDENKNIVFCNGALTECILSENIFIADELNLSSEETMNSLGPILEENFKYKLYIPGLCGREKINNKFLFISCQNLSSTLGRKQLTNLLKSRIKIISYTEFHNRISEFQNICSNINNALKNDTYNNNDYISKEDAENLGTFVLRFNKKNEGLIYNLNFRDVKKILKRIYFQKNNKISYIGFNIYNNILFYILAQTKEKNKEKISKFLIPLLAEIFNEDNKYYNNNYYNNLFYNDYNEKSIYEKIKSELEECFYSETKIIEEKGKIYLSKGKCKINIDTILTKNDKNNILLYNKLDTFLESLFLSKLALNDEPLLILGDTGYKTFLAEKLLNNKANIINLNSQIKLNYLLGSSIFYSKKDAGIFYLKNYLNLVIDDFSKERKFNIYKFKINNDGKIDKETKKNLKKYLKNEILLENIILEYNPGLITYAYLGKENIILKNISYLDTSILERFNELFFESQMITLNEDIHKTFTEEKDKILKLEHIRIIATSYSEYENKLSEAIISRFTTIEVKPYSEKEENIMIRLYSKENNLKIKEEDFKIFEDFSFDYKNTFKQKIHLKQKLNIVNILSRINNEFDDHIKNTKLTLYMLMKNSFKNINSEKLKILKEILNQIYIEYKNGESPLKIEKKNNNSQLISKITKLNIEINNNGSLSNDNIYFHENFSELIDIIHFSLYCKVGFIIEGMKGQGKKTAINYIANILGYKVLNIYLNESTKIEDIFGSLAFENENNELKMLNVKTDFVKTLENTIYTIIIFHNINKANSSIIDLIANFYSKKREVYNTNPQYNYNFFISIFNYENNIKAKDF